MAYSYGGHIKFDQSIDFTNKAPLDIRVVVPTILDLDTIENPFVGLLTYVVSAKRVFVCNAVTAEGKGIWNQLAADAGLPLLTLEMYDELEQKPAQYVHVHDPSEIDGCIEDEKTYTTSINGTYVDVLFSALRALLTEVAKLRNSFIYGINSYNDTDTALSSIQEHYGDDIDEEPLWAISETDLTELLDVYEINLFEPAGNVTLENETLFHITGKTSLTGLSEYAPKDTKIVAYITTNHPTITMHLDEAVLGEIVGDGSSTESKNKALTKIKLDIDFSFLDIPVAPVYNIMAVISRTIKEKGDNYIWISVDDLTKDFKLIEGYYNPSTKKVLSEKLILPDAYSIYSIDFTDVILDKIKLYSKYQDFSESVIPSKPSELDYKYRTAHITIRSVKNYTVLQSIAKQIQNNELIMVEEDSGQNKKGLYIKNRDVLIPIGGTSTNNPNNPNNPMDRDELLLMLQEMGIIYTEDGKTLELANIDNLTFIHQDTGNIYKVSVDAYGNLTSELLNGITGTEERLLKIYSRAPELEPDASGKYKQYTRGFVGQLGLGEYYYEKSNSITAPSDIKLYADRVKIGSFYAPKKGRSVYGCSHGFIQLENTGVHDFDLNGSYLHFAHPKGGTYQVEHLALHGTVPAGGTFLIRCKQYAEFTDANTFVKVQTYDMEWYVEKELLDLSYDASQANGYGFCLTYGKEDLEFNTQLVSANDGTSYPDDPTNTYLYMPYYIDGVYFYKGILNSSGLGYWTGTANVMNLAVNKIQYDADVIFKNSFMLDPAKQAFQALNAKDSSRLRNANVADYYYVPLEKEYIEFPKSDERYPVSNFTPHASFEKANVCTDKSKLDANKPNMVTVAFGIDAEKTRCFNWVSVGLFDEYIWIKKSGTDTWQCKFESYKATNESDTEPEKTAGQFAYRKWFKSSVNNPIYARITSRFPADNTQFTVHKCIVELGDAQLATTAPVEYTYIVGRADKSGNPDPEHISQEQTFKLYPKNWPIRIYQTSDQQGFHWVEYQVWNATAKQMEELIDKDYAAATTKFIPVLMNTGDMTQSGARINEWFDYYQAGKNLFKKMEQVNVVGNNDLCGSDPLELGTGDDAGKSNSYYFHLFYCYEVNPDNPPIIKNKCVPSLYYIDFAYHRLIMVNSELTQENSLKWFKLTKDGSPVNPYTGWAIPCVDQGSVEGNIAKNYLEEEGFTPVYTMLYKMMDTTKKIIVACHEMPFTVITNDNIKVGTIGASRSMSGSSLVGSHLNQLNGSDKQSNYWFSRLLEYKGVKLCLGGHKHTYAVTWPLRENYQYGDKNSREHGPMVMTENLKYDNVNFVWDAKDHSKFPLLTLDIPESTTNTIFFPCESVTTGFVRNDDVPYTHGVIYFMCQSSGFKLFSNKELPTVDLKFSQYIPKSEVKGEKYSASLDQRSPMYAIIDVATNDTYTIQLLKLVNIQIKPDGLLTPLSYGTAPIQVQSLVDDKKNGNYGKWVDGVQTLMTISN